MNDDFEAAKKKIEARKRIKQLKKELKLEKAFASVGIESPQLREQRVKIEQEREYAAVPLETKQKFLDLMASGKNLGQAREAVGVSLHVATQIVLRNYESIDIFPSKAKV